LDHHLAFDTISSHGWHRMSVRSIYALEYNDVFFYHMQSISKYICLSLGTCLNTQKNFNVPSHMQSDVAEDIEYKPTQRNSSS
jgi:hypothetical protein